MFFSVLLAFLSGRIVKPFSENYEKQKRFITDAGHEIKTPLAIIKADAELLEMELAETELAGNEWLQDIQTQTERLTGLTNDLIYLSRMEENDNRMQMIDFPFSDMVKDMAQSFQAVAKTGGKTFTCNEIPLLSLRGDEKALSQMVSVLLDNAVKYSGEKGEISLTLEKQGKNLRLCVSNTAEGISQENIKHMFERFYRADASRSSGTAGYGIGLSIARAVVAAHKGKISASSRKGGRVEVTVLLPV